LGVEVVYSRLNYPNSHRKEKEKEKIHHIPTPEVHSPPVFYHQTLGQKIWDVEHREQDEQEDWNH
jgi:hypothetical protein